MDAVDPLEGLFVRVKSIKLHLESSGSAERASFDWISPCCAPGNEIAVVGFFFMELSRALGLTGRIRVQKVSIEDNNQDHLPHLLLPDH